MNKTVILASVTVFGMVGSYIPVLFGESALGGWSVLGSVVGGLFGVWFGVFISRRLG